jgi:uncharacterized membrane protein (DUF2068 family)
MNPTLRFKDLNGFGRAIIVGVGVLTAGVAAVAFMTSYGALYALVRDTGLYSERLTRFYPLLLDAAFIVAELAAILGGILRGPRGWPITVMLITGTLTVAFNVMHAMGGWGDWTRGLIAALPPVLMIMAFQIDLAIVAWVMRALGRTEQAFGEAGAFLGVPQSQMPSPTRLGMGQIGQKGGGGEGNKKAAILAVAGQLGTEEITAIGPEGITAHLAEYHGIQTTPNYVRKVLSETGAIPSRNGKDH